MGYRVFMAGSPARALDRFSIQPFDALLIDAGTTGEEGRYVFERIMKEAERHALTCGGILILSEDQADWGNEIEPRPNLAVLVRPVTLKQVVHKLRELAPIPTKEAVEAGKE